MAHPAGRSLDQYDAQGSQGAHRQQPERVWGVATELELIDHPAEGRMLPIFHPDPAIRPSAAIGALAVL
jgi:hypothetical protein